MGGTCRMGDDPRTSVVDRHLRTHDHPNLYLVGSAAFPTITASPPTLTIAAFALRAALTIRTELLELGQSRVRAVHGPLISDRQDALLDCPSCGMVDEAPDFPEGSFHFTGHVEASAYAFECRDRRRRSGGLACSELPSSRSSPPVSRRRTAHGSRIIAATSSVFALRTVRGAQRSAIPVLTRDLSTSSTTSTIGRTRDRQAMRQPVRRDEVVEVGNLASKSPGAAREMIGAMRAHLRRAGFEWVTFTATRELRNTFVRLGLDLHVLCAADPRRVPGGGAGWGRYYAHDPVIVFGGLAGATRAIAMKVRNAMDDGQQVLGTDALAARAAQLVVAAARCLASHRRRRAAGRQRARLDRRRSRRRGRACPAGSAAALFHAGADRRGSRPEWCRRARADDPRVGHALGFGDGAPLAGTGLSLQRREVHDAPPLPPGTAKITFTSGTTGTPRGVCLDDAHQWLVAESIVAALRDVAIERHLCLLPLAVLLENVAGVYAPLVRGATACVPPVATDGPSRQLRLRCRGVPSGDRALLGQQRDPASADAGRPHACVERGGRPPESLRFMAVGGAKVAPSLIARARAAGLPVFEGYGLSECASVVALNVPGARPSRQRGTRVAACARRTRHERRDRRARTIVPRLHRRDASTRRCALATGDLGRVDAAGFVHVDGRRKGILITAYGRNVSPEWPEAELVASGVIAQAAVFGDARPSLCAVLVRARSRARRRATRGGSGRGQCAPARLRAHRTWVRAARRSPLDNGLATANGRVRRDAVLDSLPHVSIDLYESRRITMPFHDNLVAATADARAQLFTVPVITDCLAGRVTRAPVSRVPRRGVPPREAHRAASDVLRRTASGEKAWLRDAVAEYIEEERGHDQWILDDIAAAGGNAHAVRNGCAGRRHRAHGRVRLRLHRAL